MRVRSIAALAAIALGQLLAAVGSQAASAQLSTPPPPNEPVIVHKVAQYNICGLLCNNGNTVEVAQWVASWVSQFRFHFVSLNEICRSQLREINMTLRDWGVVYHWRHGRTKDVGSCEYGNGVLWSDAIWPDNVASSSGPLPTSPGAEPRGYVCAAFVSIAWPPPNMNFCSTHVGVDANADAQIASIQNSIQYFASRGYRELWGGDFNKLPPSHSMNPMYKVTQTPPGSGITTESETCRCGLTTYRDGAGDHKIDYVFFTDHWKPRSTSVGAIHGWGAQTFGLSDHRFLLADIDSYFL